MKKRLIGNLEVSEIGMGCMGFSHGYGKVPEEGYALDAIRKAYETGCTFFDTAEVYGDVMFYPGHNEQLVGKAISGFRKDVVLATKLFIYSEELCGGKSVCEAVRTHLEKSLANLNTDYIDLYYLHRINAEIPLEEVAEAMGGLIKKGVIRAWGLSQVGVETLDKAHAITPVAAVQNLYSMLERDCEKEIFPYCMEHGIGIVPFSPIASGFLSGKIHADTQFEAVDDVRNFVPQLKKRISKQTCPYWTSSMNMQTRKAPRPPRFHWHGCSTNIPMSCLFPARRIKSASSKTSARQMWN